MAGKRAVEYFEFLAKLGVTKHYGSLDATRELAKLCQIGPGQAVLDLGCGVGATPVYLARELGGQVVGADLIEGMVQKARVWAEEHHVQNKTAFIAADARVLPFSDNTFDVLLLESVNVFFEDKLSAFREYVRVIRPGGYLGITEMTWLQTPREDYEEIFLNAAFVTALEKSGWLDLFVKAGLENVTGYDSPIDVSRESKGRLERYGRGTMLKVILRMLKMILTDKSSRSFFKDGSSGLSRDTLDYVGYGVYTGKKPI